MTPQDPLPGFSLEQANSLASQLNSMTGASKQPEPEVAKAPAAQADPNALTAEQYKADVATMTTRVKDTENPVSFLRAVKENPEITKGVHPDSVKLFTDSMESGLLPDIKKVYGIDDEAAKQKLYADPTMLDYGHELVHSVVPASEKAVAGALRGWTVSGSGEIVAKLRDYLTKDATVDKGETDATASKLFDAAKKAKDDTEGGSDWRERFNKDPLVQQINKQVQDRDTRLSLYPAPGGVNTLASRVSDAMDSAKVKEGVVGDVGKFLGDVEKAHPEDPRMAGGKAEAFIQGAAAMPANLVLSMVTGVREANNYAQLYDQAYQEAQQVAKEKGQTLTEDDLHATATTAALINLPVAEIASLVMLKGAGKLLPAPLANKISAFASANPKLAAIGTLTGKALTQGVAQLSQNTVTNVVTGADAGRGAENAFVGGVGGGLAATVLVDGVKDGGRALARRLRPGEVPNTPTGAGAPGLPGDPQAVPGPNGKVVDVGGDVVDPGTASVDPGLVGRVRSAFNNLDNMPNQFTDEQKAATKAKIMGMLTPEEHAVVDAALNPKAAAEAPPVAAPVAAPVVPPAAAASPTAEAPHGENTAKVLQMVDIEHALGLNPDQKGKMQGEILASMPPEKQQAVIDLFQQAHNNAAELERLRSVAPETAAAMGPEFQSRLGAIIDKLHALDPKPAAKAEPVAVEPAQITPVVRAEIEHGLTEAPEHTTEPTAVDLAIGAAAAPNMTPSGYAKSKPFRAELTNFLAANPAGGRKDVDIPGLAATFHQQALNAAVAKGRAVNAWAMEAYGLPVPEGYVPEGKQLVHNPDKAAQLKAAAAPAPEPEQPNTAIAEVPAPTHEEVPAKVQEVPAKVQGQTPGQGDAPLAQQGQGGKERLLTPAKKAQPVKDLAAPKSALEQLQNLQPGDRIADDKGRMSKPVARVAVIHNTKNGTPVYGLWFEGEENGHPYKLTNFLPDVEEGGRIVKKGEAVQALPTANKEVTSTQPKDKPTNGHLPLTPTTTETKRGTGSDAPPAGELPNGRDVPGGKTELRPHGRTSPAPAPLSGLPSTADIPGLGIVKVGPFGPARDAATAYMRTTGRKYTPPTVYSKVDPARATRIAAAFESMAHAPHDPAVAASYAAMIKETLAQWEAVKKTGLIVEPIKPGMVNPYGASPRLATQDVVDNNHLWFFPTDFGFGGTESAAEDISGNPLMAYTGEELGGLKLRANDVFRIVHDYFGHVKEGLGFRAAGEENAWLSHAAMYSTAARPAMTTETRGQNSWVNYGPFRAQNRAANGEETQYAPQKTGLLPSWVETEGVPTKEITTPEQRIVSPSDALEAVKGEGDAPVSPEEALIEKSAPDGVREEGKVWKDGTVQAFANPKVLAEYFRKQGLTPAEASRKTLALVKERKAQGREINSPDSFDEKRVASLYAAALSASHSGTGFNLEKLAHLLDKMRDHLTRNESETGNPETRIKKATGEVTNIAWKGPLGLVSRDAQNYNKNMGTGGIKVALHVLDGEHGGSGDSADAYQLQGNEVAHNEATPAADRAVVAAGAHSADFHGNPRQALEAKERGDMRKRLHGMVNTRIGDFITNMAASGNFGSREDIEAATFKMALKVFPAKLVDVPVDKNGRVKGGRPSPGVSELMGDEDFQGEFLDLRKDIGETIVRDFGDARPRLSDHALTPSDLTAEDVAHGLRPSTEGMGEIGKNVLVVQSESDLPQHVRDSILRNNQTGRVQGMYDPATHDIYIVADAHQNVEEAERTLLHEAIGEHGLDQVLPAHDWAAVREALLSDPEAAAVSDTYKGKELSQLSEGEKDTVAREAFARMAEEPTFKPSLWDKIVNLVNTALRNMGFAVKYGAAELRSMIQQARNAVSRGTVEPQSLHQKMEAMTREEAQHYVKEQTGRDPVAESFDRVTRQRFAEDYGLADGVDGLMKAVSAKESDPVIRALAEALVGRAPRNTRITLNPELALRGLGGRFLARQNSIEIDPIRGGRGLHRSMVEEVMHSAIFDKLRSFSTGDDTNLSAEDHSNLLALSAVYGEVLQNHAPAEVLALATDPNLNAIARNDAFVALVRDKPELAPWYRALSMDEFVAGALTDGEFQKRLGAIARVDGGDDTVARSANSLFARVRELFTKLVTGGREDTALHQTTENSLSLIERANGANRMTEPGSEIVTAYDPELGSLKDVFDGVGHLLSTAKEVIKGRDELGKACIRIFADRMNDLREAELFMAKKRGLANLPDAESAHLASENYHGKVPYRLEQMEKTYITPIAELVKAIKAEGGSIDDANQWLYASHARERNMHVASINTMFPDGGSGMTTADAQGHLARLGSGPFGPELRQISALVQKMAAEDLANHESYGLMTPELRQILTNKYANYISLQGKEGDHTDEAEGIFPSLGKGFDIRGSEPKRALGRSTMATNVLANTFEQFGRNIIRQEKNYVLQRLAELVDKNPDPAFWERPAPTMEPYFDKAASKVKTRETHGYLRDEKVIAYKEAGVIKYLDIKHEGLRRNIKNAGLASNSLLEKVFFGGIGTLNRFKAATVTKYSPDFIVSNLFRDIGEASMNLTSPEMAKVKGQIRKDMLSLTALSGAHEAIMHEKSSDPWAVSYRELAKAGGLIEYYGLNDLKNDIAHAVGALKKTPISDGAHWVADHTGISAVGKFLSTYGSVVETSTRLAVYHNLRKSGVSIDRAAHAARTITVNFNRKGELGPIINTLYLFANANIQSNMSMVRSLKQRGAKGAAQVILGGMALGATMGAYNRMAGGVDEKTGMDHYDSIPDHVRHSNIVAMVPEVIRKGVKGIPGIEHLLGEDGRYISFPMPYGYNTLVSSGTTIEKFYAGKMTAAHTVGDIFSSLADAFNPLGGMGSLTQMITPTALRPVVDINTNKKFDGTPMYPDDSPSGGKLPDSSKYFRSASAPAVALTKKVNEVFGGNDFHSGSLGPVDMSVSPATVDYMTGFVFGSVGDTLKRIASLGMKTATGDTAKIQANEIPVARRFVGGETDVVSRQAYQYIVDASKVAMGEVRTDGKMGRAEDFQGAATSQLPELQISGMVKQIGKARMQLAQRRALLNDEGNKTDPAVKKAALDWIDDTDLALQKEVVKEYVKLKKAQIEAEQKKDQKGTRQKGDLKPRNLTLDMQ